MVSEAGASVYSASRLCERGTAGSRRVPARRGLDRAPPAGPARRTGEDRSEIHRRRPVPARSLRDEAVALARRGGGGLRERGRRRREHRVGAAARPRVRRRRGPGARTSSRIATPKARSGRRKALQEVPRLGPKAFEQCAGFLRIPDGDDPLDASRVHPGGLSGRAPDRRRDQDATSRS